MKKKLIKGKEDVDVSQFIKGSLQNLIFKR